MANNNMRTIEFDDLLFEKYGGRGPRYTSYPTAVQFRPDFDEAKYREVALQSNEEPIPRSLSLYLHIPFCETLCYYCACNKFITRHRDTAVRYLDYLITEIRMQGELYDHDRVVEQLHFGGGTPTYLSTDQI